jgi:hypothetical protein
MESRICFTILPQLPKIPRYFGGRRRWDGASRDLELPHRRGQRQRIKNFCFIAERSEPQAIIRKISKSKETISGVQERKK